MSQLRSSHTVRDRWQNAAMLLAFALVSAVGLRAATAQGTPREAKKEALEDRVVGRENVEATESEPHDPSQHFNFFNVHYPGKDEYGGTYGDNREVTPEGVALEEEEPMSPPFIFLIGNFVLMLFILGKYLWPAAGKLASDRHDHIKSALDEAKKLRDQAAQRLADYELRIKDVDREIKTLVDGIRADAEADRVRIVEAANAQAAQMQRDAEQRIAAEIELARNQLTQEVTAAAAQAAEKLLKERATPADQHNLVSSFISGISGSSRSSGAN